MKKILTIILDGFGMKEEDMGNAVKLAHMNTFTNLWNKYPHSYSEASEEAVGLMPNQAGNSEVGHMTIGAGRLLKQNEILVNEFLDKPDLENKNVIKLLNNKDKDVHIMGLCSDGNIHAGVDDFLNMFKFLVENGFTKIHFHLITDVFIQYQALRKRWNRILEKLSYIEPYTLRMSSMSFEEYFENGRKYNPELRRTTALDRYKRGMREKWKNPNSVDTRAIKTPRDVAVYMTKYMTKQPTELANDESLLERGSEFGRAWFCSRSLSRLQTYHRMSLSQAQELIDFVYKGESTKEIIGDFFRVIYFRISELGNQFEAWLRGWFLHNAYLSNYIYPT